MVTTLRTGINAGRRVSTNGDRPPRTPVLFSLGQYIGKRLPRWPTVRTSAMQWSAGGLVTWAAGATDLRLGAAVGAAVLLVLEALGGETPRQ